MRSGLFWRCHPNANHYHMQADPYEYVRDNKEQLREIVVHGTDEFTRALALQFLIKYGEKPDLNQVKREIEMAMEVAEA